MMPYGNSVRTVGPGDEIDHVTLLYIRVREGVWNVSRWFATICERGLQATEARLLKMAQSSDPAHYAEFRGYGFENIEFIEYMCFFTIILDAPGYSFHDGKDTDPLWFLEKKENSSLAPPPAPVAPNRSFFDLEMIEIGGYPALRCRNYMCNGYTGEPLKEGEEQGFIFNLYIRGRYEHGGDGGVVLAIDPDGVSKGPRK